MSSELRTAFLISGGGSTAEAAIKAEIPRLDPVAVISSRYDAAYLSRADQIGVPTFVVSRREHETREEWADALLKLLQDLKVDLVSQNGWMPLTPPNVIAAFQDYIINQHPGALDPGSRPDFGGKGMHGKRVTCAVLAYHWMVGTEAPITEATVHRVTDRYDEGELISVAQLEIPGLEVALTSEQLWERRATLLRVTDQVASDLLPLEHQNVINALKMFAEGGVESHIRHNPLISEQNTPQLEQAKQLTNNIFQES